MAEPKLTFATLKKGMQARVVRILSDSEETVRLQEMGLTAGTFFRVVKVAPFGDPIEIELRGYRLCLRKRETDCFEIEAAD
jgi:ferrous iron transport protein A